MSEQEYVANTSMDFAETSASDVLFSIADQKKLAYEDIKNGLKRWSVWLMLAYQDIKLRYRRSVLGPFWITLSMAITVYTMGYLYGHLFHVELERYYPFLVAGMISWTLIASLVNDMSEAFNVVDGLIKQIKLPFTLYLHRVAARNFIIFFHNLLVLIPVLLIFHTYASVNLKTLFLLPGVLLLYINALAYGLILSMIGARYRDISQVIKSLIQVIFFITPVMWAPEVLGDKHLYVIDFNPFYALVEIIRAPLLGYLPSIKVIFMVLLLTVFGLFCSFKSFTKYRSRIVYWL